MYHHTIKRLFDLVVTIPALIVLSPILACLVLTVRLKLGAPLLFRQQRPDLHGKSFTIYKFRAMTDVRDEHGNLPSDAERLPPFGQFLRDSSSDELPELWNVLRGDMGLVGIRTARCYSETVNKCEE